MNETPNMVCPKCGHRSWLGEVRSPVEVSVIMGCVGCGTAMDRLDALGEIERELRGDAAPINLRVLLPKDAA